MGKRNVKLRYKDMIAIKHALLASVNAEQKMAVEFKGKEASGRIPQLLRDIEHEETLAKLIAAEARAMIGGKNNAKEQN